MATKKTNSKAPVKQQKRSTPSISARIDRLVDYENSKVKAIASVNIGGAFAIHGLRVIDSQKGLFVQMPQNSFQKDGKTEYSDIFHPITADARTELNSKVLEAARDMGMNISQTVDELLAAEVQRRYWERWNATNQEAIAAYNARIESEGLPLAQYRSF